MEPKSIAQHMVALQAAIDNCERSGNTEWLAKHRESLRLLVDLLPSGSGIDGGTTLVDISTGTSERIKLACSFHHMNEDGFYDGWTEHTIIARASFLYGITLSISGPDRQQILEYLHDVYASALAARVMWDSASGAWVYEVRS